MNVMPGSGLASRNPRKTYKQRWFGRRQTGAVITNLLEAGYFGSLYFDNDGGGMRFGAWVDQNSRNNGYDENDIITNPAYIIESILRDVMHISTDKIDYASFDVAGNTSTGILIGWSFTGGLYKAQSAKDVLENILMQCKCQLVRDASGKFKLIVYNSSASVDYTDYDFNVDNHITNLSIEQSAHDDIVSEVRINYALDRGSDNFRKCAFVKAGIRFSGTYLAEAIDSTGEYEWDVDDGTCFVTNEAPGAPTAALAGLGAGNVDNGTHYYKVTLVTDVGETEAGTASSVVTVADKTVNGQIALSAIPTGNSLVTARKIYRTKAGASTYYLMTTLSNNSTTTYTDNIPDGGLSGTTAPTANTTGQYYIYTDREMNLISSVAGNTITLTSAAGVRTVYHSSKKTTHADNAPIFILETDSDDGSGETPDLTRESTAAKAIWKNQAKGKIEIDADWIIDLDTATALRDYYVDYYCVPHWIISFDCTLHASDLSVGSIIEFDTTIMDAYLKVGGASWSGYKWRVESISRTGSMDYHITAVKI